MTEYSRRKYIFATDAYISEGWMGHVSLAPEWWDKDRYEAGVVRMLLHHDHKYPTGEIRDAWYDEPEGDMPGLYRAEVDIPTGGPVAYINNYLWQLDNTTLMDSTSVGFRIKRLELVEVGPTWFDDKLKAAWEWYEFSAVSSPADVLAAVERSGGPMASPANAGRESDDYILTRGGLGLGYVQREIVDTVKKQADVLRQLRRWGG